MAVYRARYAPKPVPEGPFVSLALGPVPEACPRQDAYSAAGDALLRAEQCSLLQRTPAQLAQERANLRSAMAAPSAQRLTQAIGHQNDAQRALTEAEARHAGALDAQRSAERGFLRRPTAKRIEAAGIEVEASLAARAAAADTLRRATERVAALQPDALAEARLPLEQRLARIDRAIAAHVDDAVASPAPYLAEALGPRPTDPAQRERWNTAARRIETWRQAELGLPPSAGEWATTGWRPPSVLRPRTRPWPFATTWSYGTCLWSSSPPAPWIGLSTGRCCRSTDRSGPAWAGEGVASRRASREATLPALTANLFRFGLFGKPVGKSRGKGRSASSPAWPNCSETCSGRGSATAPAPRPAPPWPSGPRPNPPSPSNQPRRAGGCRPPPGGPRGQSAR